ncbi:nicotinate (nicotinamide) nucleotide adenylyltransferase [Buchnera aphidicola (Taiwanaphis decaspermi)]|uniref:nicotinate (nicotinamide) nucleotide adenylyltransferase n=1 Tax=Buchnera aphidicola TaxID=9 RepID=UPI0031B85A9D
MYILFGGTFNPIHYGHLFTANYIYNYFKCSKIIFLPNKQPYYKKKTKISCKKRVKMLKLAIKKKFEINLLEVKNKKKLYTINTIILIKKKIKKNIYFLMGYDSLINFYKWYKWESILKICNILVIKRKNKIYKNIKKKIKKFITYDIYKFLKNKNGLIFVFNNFEVNISSSNIRKRYKKNKSCTGMLPKIVDNFIKKNKLYKN